MSVNMATSLGIVLVGVKNALDWKMPVVASLEQASLGFVPVEREVLL
jgi:hypothetical protein